MGRHKLLLPWHEGTVIEGVLATWLASQVSRILLIVRPDDERLRRHLDSLSRRQATPERQRWEVVVPASPPPEMKDSVLHGLQHVATCYRPQADDVWLLAPADMPRFRASTIDRLLQCYRPAEPQVLRPVFHGRRGHPVLFPWPMADEVARLPAGQGIRDLVAGHSCRSVECDDPSILEDLDTPEDYARLRPPHDDRDAPV